MRILLIEDDTQFAELLHTQLRRLPLAQARLEVAGTLADALAKVETQTFSLVLVDLNLPDAAGLQAVEALSRVGEQLIIVLTGDENPALRAAALECGAHDFLSKEHLSAAGLERLVRLAAIQARTYGSLRESETRFRSLIELSSDFYWESDAQHRVTHIARGPQHLTVADAAQLGKARWDRPATRPDAAGWAAHKAVMDAHLPFRDFEIARLDDDGVERHRSISGVPVFDEGGAFKGYRGVGREITARKQAEEALQRFRLAMDSSADLIVLIDRASMRYVDVNETACKLLGYSREELLGMGPQDLIPVSRAELERVYDRMISEPSVSNSGNTYYHCKDGSRLPVDFKRRVLRSGNGWLISSISRDARERMAAERALQESEARFRGLTELSSDWYWEQDEHFRITLISRREATGLDSIGFKPWELQALNMDEADWKRHRAQLEGHESFRDLELERPGPGGASVWVSVSGEPMFGPDGAFKGYRGIGRNITQRKREEQLRTLEHAVGRSLSEAGDASAGLRAVIRAVCETERWECGRYFQVDEAAGVVRYADSWGVPDAAIQRLLEFSRGIVSAFGQGLAGVVWQSGEPLWIPDVSQDPRARRAASIVKLGMRGGFLFPVKSEGRTIGVLAFSSREIRQPEERLLQSIHVIGAQVGQFLRRKQAEEEQQRFRVAMDNSADMIVLIDRRTMRFVDVNQTACKVLGYSREEMLGMGPHDILPVTREELERAYDEFIANPAAISGMRSDYRCKDGSLVPFESTRHVLRSGDTYIMAAISRDIRERLAAEREREKLASMYAALGAANEAIQRAGTMQEVFDRVCEIAVEAGGFQLCTVFLADTESMTLVRAAASGVAAPLVKDRVPRIDASQPQAGGMLGEACRSGKVVISNDYQADPRSEIQRAQFHTYLPRSAAVIPLHAEGRLVGLIGLQHAERNAFTDELVGLWRRLAEDVSFALENFRRDERRVKAEQELRDSEVRFRSLTKLSSDWYWESNAQHRFTKFEGKGSDDTRGTILGRAVWEMGDEAEGAWEAHRQVVARHESFRHFEYSYTRRNGERVHIQADGEPMFDAQGRFTGYRGTSRDITQQRRDERRLRQFRAAMDTSADMIMLVDRETLRYVDVNATACEMNGRSHEEMLGIGPLQVSPITREELERGYDEMIATGKVSRLQSWHHCKDGKRIPVDVIQRAVRAGDRWIIVAVLRDISDLKAAEERQGALLRRQERIARFGQSALGKREPQDLIDEAAQTVLEALLPDAVAYVELGPKENEVVLRACVGLADPGAQSRALVSRPDDPLVRALRSGERLVADGAALPFPWAAPLRCAALVPVRGTRGALCVFNGAPAAFAAEELNFIEAAASVLSTALQRIESEGRLAFLAQFDPLTGLPNRALLSDRFSQMIVQARRHGTPLGVLFIDLDEFKIVNDTLGHAGGDALLKEVAVRLQATVRPGDTVARISGDEFAVVLADLARLEDAALVAQKIIDRLSQAVEVHGKEVFVTASVGIAAFPGDGGDAEALLGAADAAMYRAKQAGRNAYQFFTAEINQRSRARAQMGAELRRALERQEFALVYQPKYDLQERRVRGAEALLRWKHPERGMVSPGEFVPVLEETGLIVAVGEWVLRRACEDLKAWQAEGLEVRPVAVNLSARQFRLPDLDQRIKAIVAGCGVDAGLIELEITESQLMQDPDHAIRIMRALCDAGMRIAIDDFGTGYSSLAYLTRFPVGALKIDRSFVADVNDDASDATIVRTIIDMAHTLGFSVIAEGIETEAQAAYLHKHGCELAQGYLFARPMPAADLARLLSRPA